METGARIGRLSGGHAIKENMDWNVPGVVVGRGGEVRVGGVHADVGQGEVGLKGGVDIHNVGEGGKGGVGKGGSNTPLALISEVGGPGERSKDVRGRVKRKEKFSNETLGPEGAA